LARRQHGASAIGSRAALQPTPDKERAVESVRKRVPVNKGEEAEAVAEVAGNEFVGQDMRPGDVRRHD
jgi:hypothetical protein